MTTGSDTSSRVVLAQSAQDVARCYPVMQQLRGPLTRASFTQRVALQAREGYQLALVEDQGEVVAVAGFRIYNLLFSGKTLYVDDLVTDSALRSQGFGEILLQWLVALARESGCQTFSLDSGVQRSRAHRFYFMQGMKISSFHFDLGL